MELQYSDLHLHTDASFLDGLNDIPRLMKRLKELGRTSCAISDHGNMANNFKFYRACLENDIKPLLGCEFYITQARQLQKKSYFETVAEFTGDDFVNKISHLVVLAKDWEGYQNLTRLCSEAVVYGKPRIDYELLKKYNKGLVIINGHVGTDVAQMFERYHEPIGETEEEKEAYKAKEIKRAYETNQWYKDVFGDDYYLEVQNHWLNIEEQVSPLVIKLAKDSDTKLVITNDAHYTWREDADAHRIHMSNGLSKSYDEFMNGDFEGFSTCDEFYIKSNEEMIAVAETFGDVGLQAIANIQEIVDKCNVGIPYVDFGGTKWNEKKEKNEGIWKTNEYLFPNFTIPAPYASAEHYAKFLSKKGLDERKAEGRLDLETFDYYDYEKRLDYELSVINDMGFPTYFLILWDVIEFCRIKDIPVGKGRGSGAGSLVCYALRITDIEPLKYDLLFERFLNPHRISMPDIDSDFCYERIDEVIEFVREKYGSEFVCKIGTFGTLGAKAVIKDVSRVLRYDYQKTNELTTKVKGTDLKLKKILVEYPEFLELAEKDEEFARVLEVSKRLEGLQRHTSQHAAGVIISPFPLTDVIPTRGIGVDLTSQWDMGDCELLGFVKMDFLRLRTLTVVKNATNSIQKATGTSIDIDNIDFEDDKVFEEFRKGSSLGIFQFESDGMKALLKRQGPKSILDLSAVNALYRPGPLDCIVEDHSDPNYGKTMVEVYVSRANGEQETVYDHPLLEKVQYDTYGVFVYQEQVMNASVVLAGFSLPEADELRKVVGKKLLDKMPEQKDKFVRGCLANHEYMGGCMETGKDPQATAEKIWGQVETFGRYGFNKSHSTAYAVLAYQSMWLKVYYPAYFMASVLSSLMGEKIEKIVPYLNECRVMNIELLPPHINHSSSRFVVSKDEKGVHFGLVGISGVGPKATENILEIKERHSINNLVDFIALTSSSVNKSVTTALIQCGAFDFLGYNRKTLVNATEHITVLVQKAKQKINNNKKRKKPLSDISVFWEPVYDYQIEVVEEYSLQELCVMERTLTGFYMTYHPLDGLIKYIRNKSTHSSYVINNGIAVGYETEEVVDAFGEVSDVIIYDENGEPVEHVEKLPVGQTIITGGVIKSVNLITIRNGANTGKTMASFILEDAYQGDIKCTIFNKGYERHESTIKEGSIVFVQGKMDYYRESAQILVDTLSPINRESAKAERQRELLIEITETEKDIKLAEETIEMFIENVEQISNVCDYLEELYDKLDETKLQLEEDLVA